MHTALNRSNSPTQSKNLLEQFSVQTNKLLYFSKQFQIRQNNSTSAKRRQKFHTFCFSASSFAHWLSLISLSYDWHWRSIQKTLPRRLNKLKAKDIDRPSRWLLLALIPDHASSQHLIIITEWLIHSSLLTQEQLW